MITSTPASWALSACSSDPTWCNTVAPVSRTRATTSGITSQKKEKAITSNSRHCRNCASSSAGSVAAGIRLTANDRLVAALKALISDAINAGVSRTIPNVGYPPAFATAAASCQRATPPIPANNIGTLHLRMEHNGVWSGCGKSEFTTIPLQDLDTKEYLFLEGKVKCFGEERRLSNCPLAGLSRRERLRLQITNLPMTQKAHGIWSARVYIPLKQTRCRE